MWVKSSAEAWFLRPRRGGGVLKTTHRTGSSISIAFYLYTWFIKINRQRIIQSPLTYYPLHCCAVSRMKQKQEHGRNSKITATPGSFSDTHNAVIPTPFPQWPVQQHRSRQMLTWPPATSPPSPAGPAAYFWLWFGFGSQLSSRSRPVRPPTIPARLSVYKRFLRSHT